jgi:tetratricopeptide (TPR) repeat protein
MSLFESCEGSRIRETGSEERQPPLRRAARRAVRTRRERVAPESVVEQCDLFPNFASSADEAKVSDAPVQEQSPRPRPILKLVELPASSPEMEENVVASATAPDPTENLSAEEWFEHAAELESESPLEARAAYHHALELNPNLVDAHVNLGRLYHVAGEHGKAEAHYRQATLLAPRDPTSHFNLGVLLEDLQRRSEAVYAYRQALMREPDYADAHYNLALLLERIGRKGEAISHLAKANALYGPNGRRR